MNTLGFLLLAWMLPFTGQPRHSSNAKPVLSAAMQAVGGDSTQQTNSSTDTGNKAAAAPAQPAADTETAKQQPAPDAKKSEAVPATSALSSKEVSECLKMTALKLADTTISSALPIPADSLRMPSPRGVGPIIKLPAFCRVQGVMKPTADSDIKFEVWMPIQDWNGKFEQVGNGGYAGAIAYMSLIRELRNGFAVASTDDGHRIALDQSWAIGHPEKVIDFGYRAVHDLSGVAKTVVQNYYAKPPSYSYFNGCSDGGREALMEAQRYPDDFNGIIAAAPAGNWTGIMFGFGWDEQALLMDPASYIPESKLPTIKAKVLAECDQLDGVTDGILEDPQLCHFNPSVLQCKGADGPDCLTKPQVTALKKIYAGPKNPVTGKQIAPGFEPGAEAPPSDWPNWIIGTLPSGGLQFAFANQFFGDMVFENPKWDYRTLNFDKDVKTTDDKLASILNANNPDLHKFKAHGGKLIQYHGWADAAVAPLNSVNYYRSVEHKMGGLKKTQDFYRLFMAPGVAHCGGGPGPNQLPTPDGGNDVVSVLSRWVEHNVAPDQIIVTKVKKAGPIKSVVMTRPLCPYPENAKWTEKGSTNEAANFVCK